MWAKLPPICVQVIRRQNFAPNSVQKCPLRSGIECFIQCLASSPRAVQSLRGTNGNYRLPPTLSRADLQTIAPDWDGATRPPFQCCWPGSDSQAPEPIQEEVKVVGPNSPGAQQPSISKPDSLNYRENVSYSRIFPFYTAPLLILRGGKSC